MKIYVPMKITTEAEAEALPEGTHVVIRDEDLTESGDAPLIWVKEDDGVFVDWQGHALTPSEIVPITALVEHEVYGRVDRSHGYTTTGLIDNGKMLVINPMHPDAQPHERMVWSTEWKKSEEQG